MAKSKFPWDKDAEKELFGVPFFVRPLVRKKVEERVRRAGSDRVTLADFKEAEARHQAVMAGKSEAEIKRMFPRSNTADVDMVIIESCHSELSECPNPLIDVNEWREAITSWSKKGNVSERLRARIKEDTIKFHHKFRVSISGCPNGCSRPQIADIGVLGSVRPDFDLSNCECCGSCAEVCPDPAIMYNEGELPQLDIDKCLGCKKCYEACPQQCISLSESFVRVMAGGKLGRHPRFAEEIAELKNPAGISSILDSLVNDYISNAGTDERFADYWDRAGRKNYHV